MSFVVSQNEREFLVAILGMCCIGVVAFPLFVWRNYNLFEPLTLIILLVLFGTPFKLIYVLWVRTRDPHVADHVLLWQEPDVFLYGLFVVVVGWLMLVTGYMLKMPRTPISNLYLPQINDWNGRKLQIVIAVVGGISLVCFLAFVVTAGVNFSSFSEMSEKRFGDTRGAGSERMHSSKYFLYRGAALSKFVVYFSIVWMVFKKRPFLSWMGVVLMVALFQTMLLSFVMNSRAGVALLLVDCMILFFYLKNKIDMKLVGLCFAVAVMLMIPMLAGRSKSEDSQPIAHLVQKTLTGRNMLDIAKTCHIINGVPSKMEHRNGEMLYAWLAAPVPKSVWPEKPMWANKGLFLNRHIFGYKGDISGVPPGLIGELYWDFGKFGVWLGLFFLGILLRQLFICFYHHRSNPTCILLYTMIITRFGMFSLGNDLGTGIVKAGLDLVPVYCLLLFIGMHRAPEPEAEPEMLPATTASNQVEFVS